MKTLIRTIPLIALVLTLAVVSCRAQPAPTASAGESFAMPDDFFPIMPWEATPDSAKRLSDPRQGIESLKECGFNTVAFATPEQLKTCEQLGLRAIVRRTTEEPVKWRGMSDEQIFQAVKKQIDEAGESKAILGYFIMDEPGVQYFPALGKAAAAVKKLAPGKLAYINLYPSYATLGAPNMSQIGTENYHEYLEKFVSVVKPQIISYDNYNVQFSNDLAMANRAGVYFTNLLAVRQAALEHNLPFWNIVSGNQVRPTTTPPSPANLLLQAYTTLAAGGRGLTWYTYYSGGYRYGPIDNAGNRSTTWSYLKMVNEQVSVLGPRMARLKSSGVYFSSAPAAGLPVLPGKVVEAIQSPVPMMVGEFAGAAGEKYAMVVNLSLEKSARFAIQPVGARPAATTAPTRPSKNAAPDASLRYISPADGSLQPMEPGNAMWLAAGQGVLIEIGR